MSIELVPFQESFLPQAGDLLAERHRRNRVIQPLLPSQFEDPAVAQAAVSQELNQENSLAVAALHNGRLLGFMAGKMIIDPLWGRSAWVSLAGYALSPDQSCELVGRMYAVLGANWVANGCFAHFAAVPVAEGELVQAWFSLYFGIEQVYGLVKLEDAIPGRAIAAPAELSIRLATSQDREVLEDLSDIIWRHQTKAPVWGICLPEHQLELRHGYADLAEDEEATVWLAFYQGLAVGFQCYFPVDLAGKALIVPDQCVELKVAGTLPHFQGLGIGQALTRHGLADAYHRGYLNCLTDWRSTNQLSARFWPLQGFQPVAYRLARRIDDRIAWAKG